MATSRTAKYVWPTLATLGLVLVYVGLLQIYLQPAQPLAQSYGLYAAEEGAQAYRWSSNRVTFPIHSGTGPTLVDLTLGDSRWPGRAGPYVALATPTASLMTVTQGGPARQYSLLVPPATSALHLTTAVARPSATDARWLGVQVLDIRATPTGWPLTIAIAALGWTALVGLAGLMLAWSARHGYGWLAAVLLLAFLLRVVWLERTPPGFSQDEAVSLVDAWHLVQTGHDHLGNGWPLGAQEALGDWISPLLTYLELPFVAVLGPGVLVGRVATALVGTVGVLFSYKVARLLGYSGVAATVVGLVAAISPWQVFLQRFALPPALVPTSWIICLWAALLFLRSGQTRAGLRLALIAGLALYAYPTLKLAVPLLVIWTTILALQHYGRRAARRWLAPALVLAVLWLPFVVITLLKPSSNTRLNQAALRAAAPSSWLTDWWAGYRVYWEPAFYYITGDRDPIHGLLDHGQQLPVEAPLVLAGLVALLWNTVGPLIRHRPARAVSPRSAGRALLWWCIGGALLIAPLPASLTVPSPHAWRAALLAPMYTLIVGLGLDLLISGWQGLPKLRWHRPVGRLVVAGLSILLLWQAGQWFQTYVTSYPATVAWVNQDGLMEMLQRAKGYASQFDYVWISTDDITEPYIYLLDVQPMVPADAQAALDVERRPGHLNAIHGLGPYLFGSVAQRPLEQTVLEAVPDHFGGPGFVLQAQVTQERRILVVRRME